jgi:hypothetical protein
MRKDPVPADPRIVLDAIYRLGGYAQLDSITKECGLSRAHGVWFNSSVGGRLRLQQRIKNRLGLRYRRSNSLIPAPDPPCAGIHSGWRHLEPRRKKRCSNCSEWKPAQEPASPDIFQAAHRERAVDIGTTSPVTAATNNGQDAGADGSDQRIRRQHRPSCPTLRLDHPRSGGVVDSKTPLSESCALEGWAVFRPRLARNHPPRRHLV